MTSRSAVVNACFTKQMPNAGQLEYCCWAENGCWRACNTGSGLAVLATHMPETGIAPAEVHARLAARQALGSVRCSGSVLLLEIPLPTGFLQRIRVVRSRVAAALALPGAPFVCLLHLQNNNVFHKMRRDVQRIARASNTAKSSSTAASDCKALALSANAVIWYCQSI